MTTGKTVSLVVIGVAVGVIVAFFVTRFYLQPPASPTMPPTTASTTPSDTTSTPDSNSTSAIEWKQINDAAQGVSYSYPEPIGTTYISTVDWPPKMQVTHNATWSCTEAGTETARAGKTEHLSVNGHEYCATRLVEGAAGSMYTQYAYVFQKGSDVASMTFTLRSVQCANYDDPQKTECEEERTAFNPDQLADQIAQTLKITSLFTQ